MSIQSTVDHVRDVVASFHPPFPMAKGRDLVARVLYGRPYSACVAAERAGKAVKLHSTAEIAQAVTALGIVRARPFLSGVIQALNNGQAGGHKSTTMRAPAAIEVLPLPKTDNAAFHRVRIEGMVFRASLFSTTEGPYLMAEGTPDGVNLGVCGLAHLDEAAILRRGLGWWICKYDAGQPHIEVNGLSALGRRLLVREFGIAPIEDADDFGKRFFKSPAFNALSRWVAMHPRLASKRRGSPYIPDWYERASACGK